MSAHPFPCCRTTIVRLLALCALLIAEQAVAAPVVSNPSAAQRVGTKLVDVSYDLAAPGFPTVAVSLEISSDGGATWTVPATSVSGAIGSSVAPGTGKIIVWDAGADWPRSYSTQMRFRVTADDGFAFIPSGSFTMGRTSGDTDTNAPPVIVTVSSFYMQKNETTKALWDEVRTWAASNGYTDLPPGGCKAVNHPVQTVTWWDVVKWCNARSEKILSWGMSTISRGKRNSLNGGGKAYPIGTSGHHPSGGAESVSKAMGMSFRKRSVPNPKPQAPKIFPAAPKP